MLNELSEILKEPEDPSNRLPILLVYPHEATIF